MQKDRNDKISHCKTSRNSGEKSPSSFKIQGEFLRKYMVVFYISEMTGERTENQSGNFLN